MIITSGEVTEYSKELEVDLEAEALQAKMRNPGLVALCTAGTIIAQFAVHYTLSSVIGVIEAVFVSIPLHGYGPDQVFIIGTILAIGSSVFDLIAASLVAKRRNEKLIRRNKDFPIPKS